MRDYLNQAEKALEVYLRRGELALERIENSDLTEFIDILRNRKAAFHNFRAAEAQVQQAGLDLSDQKKFQDIWLQVREIDRLLTIAVTAKQIQLGAKVKKFKKSRIN